MKKNIGLIAGCILLVLACSSVSFAQDKIGFINVREIIKNSNAGKKAADEFKKIADKKQAEVTAAEKELQAMKDDLEKKSSIMTAAARREKETDYQKKVRDYQLLINDAQEDLGKRDQEMFQKLIPDIWKAVSVIAQREKLTLVLDVATLPVPYYDKSRDINKQVIEEFNKTSGAKK
ncbi:MAG: OmpH family outer membrane protein [Smithellaceae bacterium]